MTLKRNGLMNYFLLRYWHTFYNRLCESLPGKTGKNLNHILWIEMVIIKVSGKLHQVIPP